MLSFLVPITTLADSYTLPAPDHRENSSAECFKGIIKEINENTLIIQNSHNKSVEVQLADSSSLFTVYGGVVFKSQIKPEMHIKVWYKGNSCNNPVSPLTAAAIIFASKKPGDTWQ